MEIFKYYNRSKRKWIVELKDNEKGNYIAEFYICNNKEEAEEKESRLNEKYGSRLYPWTVERMIKDILTSLGIECSVQNTSMKKFNPMSYNVSENCISFNIDYIKAYCLSNLFPATETVKVITYHEIGHLIDHKIHPHKREIKKNVIESELAAWKLARYLVPEDLVLLYDDLNETNMRKYHIRNEVLS